MSSLKIPHILHRRPKQKPSTDAPRRQVTPNDIRDFRELLRKRYELDVQIWGLRTVRQRDRHIVEDKMRKSDATLRKIKDTISEWNGRSAFESDEDWDKFQEIKKRIEMGGKREWAGNPPWKG